ncbi:MAG: protein kinase [Nannocystis sp.]|uniref:serine/threonine-protein kinase n=1 Tax=Nannocystis sp. TaxID=1962667 RepID=UPI002424D908|nr:serine/threonine-protein kinase [Nannocystis sp.]MBK9753464.1 protein kinase [Nannocystis sp.]
MARPNNGAARPIAASLELGSAGTLPGDDADTQRDTLLRADQDPPLAFPDLDDEHERRMEDLLAARLFPGQAAATRIGRYTLLDRIGQGGMGIVYAAYDPELDRRVAIKLLTASPGQAEARLLREAQAMARVAHANVVAVIEVGQHRGQTFVVMEHLRGISLERWPERRPHWRDTLRVYVQAGRGLAAAHRAGVIHRDFKPHNVMLVEGGVDDGRVKVLDFGLARAALPDPHRATIANTPTGALAQPLTRTGALMGTPAYMAPEQLAGEPVDERSDQFSFAVSLYEALHGQLPFAGDSLPALADAVLAGIVRPPPSASDVPAWVQRLVLRGLARQPSDRFASMTALCDALERDPAARRRNLGLAAALSAVVGGGTWALAQHSGASPCSGPAFALTEVWNDARAAAVTTAFATTGLPYAGDTARRLTPLLGDYAGAWSTMRRDTCEAHRSGEQSAALLDLRMACLDRRRASFVALTELLVHPDAGIIERAVEAALTLPSLTGCSDVATLTAETPPPDDPSTATAVATLRTTLAEIATLASTGRLGPAASAAQQTLARAETLGFHPLIAESALARGTIALEQGRGEEADAALSLAVRSGIAGRADRTAAEALIRRHFVRGALLGQLERSAAEDDLIAAHAARFPRDGALRWLAAINRGAVAYRGHDFDRARNFYRDALAVTAGPTRDALTVTPDPTAGPTPRDLAVTTGPTPLDLARTRINLGLLEYDARDFEAALASYRAAIAQASAALGDAHPLVLELATYEAAALYALGRKQAARERLAAFLDQDFTSADASQRSVWPAIRLSRLDSYFRRFTSARAFAERALAATATDDALTRINAETTLADALTDPREAQARYANIVADCQAGFGEHHRITASFLQRAGAGLLRLDLPAEARTQLRRALAISEALPDPDPAITAETRRLLAEAALALADPDAALTTADAAVTTLAALPGDHALDLALARRSLARAHLARGDADAALDLLRPALTLVAARLDPDDPDLAATAHDLARALLAADPAQTDEARALLTRARDIYTVLGEPFTPERTRVQHQLGEISSP